MAELLEAPQCLPPRPLRNPAGLRLPEGTCDSHFHVFLPDAPLASPRSYTPCMETLAGWRALAESFGIARGVLVQPSVHGTDNAVLLAALAAEPERLRGIVVIPATTSEPELQRLDDLGVRGVRINLRNKAGIGLETLEMLAPRIRALGWPLQFQVDAVAIATVAALAARHGIAGVIDHLAFMPLDPPGEALGALLRAMDGGRIYTKISASYRLADSAGHDGYVDAYLPLARYEQQQGLRLAARKYVLAKRGVIGSAALRKPGAALSAKDFGDVERLLARQEKRLPEIGHEARARRLGSGSLSAGISSIPKT